MTSKQYTRTIIIKALVFILCFFSQVLAVDKITAKHLLNTADSLALTLASNARLASIESSDIDTTGKSNSWTYVYFSFNTSDFHDKMYFLIAQNNQVTFDHLAPLGMGAGILINRWMDSDSALSIAEIAGGADIRKRYPTCTITALLFQWPIVGYPPFISEWKIDYQCSDSTRTFAINATSGDIVTSVKESNEFLPMLFELYQNYPNPFNPTTAISFQLSAVSNVSLKVYDVLGREIAILVNEKKHAGNYTVEWNAANFPSGVYFYRLQAGPYIDTKKLILLK